MAKINCWEFKKCGRQAGGENARDFHICPASIETRLDGVHGGENAGRTCWAAAGTMCKGEPSGTFAQKCKDCGECDFYNLVKNEEGENFLPTIEILSKIE